MGLTVRLKKGYKVRSNATEDSIWHFAESELNIPNVLINIPNRRGNTERNLKITFEDVTVDGGCRVVFKYANASGNMYNHIVSFKSDSTISVNFGDRIAVESISMVMDKYYQFMDSIICLEEISVEDIERLTNERRERFLRNMRDSERSSRNSEWTVVDEVEDDYYRHVSQILGHRITGLEQTMANSVSARIDEDFYDSIVSNRIASRNLIRGLDGTTY